MTSMPSIHVRAVVFDAYGTLFDVASAARRCEGELGDQFGALAELWRQKQLETTWLLAAQGRHLDFWRVTGDALDFSLETLGVDKPALRERLMQLYLALEAYPEAGAELRALKAKGMRLAILSNGTPSMLAAAVSSAGFEGLFEAVLSVETVGVYKPHPKVYQMASDRLALGAAHIAFISANAWDAYAASAFGMKVVWCNRAGQAHERLPGKPDVEVRSLAGLAGEVT